MILCWLIGAWVASGLLIPVLWLLSMAGRRTLIRSSNAAQAPRAPAQPLANKPATLNRGRMGRLFLSGLAGAVAVILLTIGSFGDPITTVGYLYSAFADPHPRTLQPAAPRAPVEVALAVDLDEAENGPQDRLRQAAMATPPGPPAWTLAMPAVPQERPGKRYWRHARRGPVGAYVTQSHRGTWLFPPSANAGGNS